MVFPPTPPLLGEDGIQIAFKQLAGAGEVLLGIGDRRRDPCKRFIENGDNALLFGEGGEGNLSDFTKLPFTPCTVAPVPAEMM